MDPWDGSTVGLARELVNRWAPSNERVSILGLSVTVEDLAAIAKFWLDDKKRMRELEHKLLQIKEVVS